MKYVRKIKTVKKIIKPFLINEGFRDNGSVVLNIVNAYKNHPNATEIKRNVDELAETKKSDFHIQRITLDYDKIQFKTSMLRTTRIRN